MAANGPMTLVFRNSGSWKWISSALAALAIITLAGLFSQAGAFTLEELERNDPLVNIRAVNPDIVVDMRYATDNNFLHRVLYKSPECFLRRSVAEKLSKANDSLKAKGYGVKCWDCYRPHSVQVEMWKILPDARYVADPKKGSNHNRGIAVDVTLVDFKGQEMEMPTGFDDFRQIAWRDYQDLPEKQKKNRAILRNAMEQAGFKSIRTEWWHYDGAKPSQYPIIPESASHP
jgi:D-alanyl-D-alanine dipeptidase